MEYKGYVGRVEFDDDAGLFSGEVINLRDVITFQGDSVGQLRQAFQDSIEDYLSFCEERGESPEKPYSGRILVRVEPSLHRDAATRAKLEHKSLNTWIHDELKIAISA